LTLSEPHVAIDDHGLDGMTPLDQRDRLKEEG
jgi:hypothetical protein